MMPYIYLDHNASTPLAPEAKEALQKWLDHSANPTSGHAAGQEAAAAIEEARSDLAQMLDCNSTELTFTSGGTESNNLAIKGTCDAFEPGHLITSRIEHPAVMETMAHMESRGWAVDYAAVDARGCVDPDELSILIRPDTRLISIMLANNETGTIQPIQQIATLARDKGIVMHTDAAQALGKYPVSVRDLGVDLLTLAGHKMNAPIGIGALFVRQGVELVPQQHGAGHEKGLRPGTLNLLEIVALGAAARRFRRGQTEILKHNQRMRDLLVREILDHIPHARDNDRGAERLSNTASLAFPGVPSANLLAACPWLAASAGAACNRDFSKASHVLLAMGLPKEQIESTIRFSVGLGTTEEDVRAAVAGIAEVLKQL